ARALVLCPFPPRRSSDLIPLKGEHMLRIARRLVVMLGLMLLAACQNLQVPAAELPDDGPPIAVSSEAALSFINKSTTAAQSAARSEEHTSELQSRENLVC